MKRIILQIILFAFLLTENLAAGDLYSFKAPDLQMLAQTGKPELTTDRPKIGLVLSGGGARGLAHVGVLQALEKYNIPIDLIVGTSMGSVVGGFYAAGYTADELEEIVRNIDWDNIFSDETARENLFLGQKLEEDRYLLNIRFKGLTASLPTSITSGQRILTIISEKLYGANLQMIYNFDDLKIPFRSVATDLITGKRVVLDHGDLAEAINASTAVPLLFAPVSWDSLWLVDGGVSSNLPVDVARAAGMDIVIAIDITSPLRNRSELSAPWEIADQVTTIMMLKQYQLQMDMADVLIKPDLEDIGSSDFDKFDLLIKRGESAVDSVAGQLIKIAGINSSNPDDQEYYIKHTRVYIDSDLIETVSEVSLTVREGQYNSASRIRRDFDHLIRDGRYRSVNFSVNDSILTCRLERYPVVRTVSFAGNHMLPDSVIRPILEPIFPGRVNIRQLSAQIEQVKTHYNANGFTLMHFDSIIIAANAVLRLKIDEGIIDSIAIIGNEVTREFVVLREFPLKVGDVYHAGSIQKGIENIYNTQLFEKVSVNVDRSGGSFKLLIKVKEKPFNVFRLGGQISSERGVQGYYELANENILGTSGKLSLAGRYGEQDRSIGLNFRIDRIFKTYLTMGVYGLYDWKLNPFYVGVDKQGEYREERSGLRFVVGQQLRKLGQMSVELRIENVKDYLHSGVFPYQQNSELRTLTVRSVTDKRDQIAFTKKGIYNIWFWETGNQKIFEGQEKYSKFFVNLEGYYTYWNHHTFHVKGVIGVGDRTLPFSEFFRIGGMESFMGLHKYELYGRQAIYVNLEYSIKVPYFKIFSDTYLGIRYDVGGIWENPDLVLEGEDFFYGIGAWLGIDTVLGPLIISVGDTAKRPAVFYASLGYNF